MAKAEAEQHGMREATREKRRSPKRLIKIVIEHAKNGGHVVTHHFERKGAEGYAMPEPEEQHVFGAGQGDEMMDHVAHHMGVQRDDASEPDDDGDEEEE